MVPREAGGGGACHVQFGAFYRKDAPPPSADYLTVWLGTHSKAHGAAFNPHWHGRMLQHVRATNSTAVFYAYVIAMLARHHAGIQDCDVGTPSLCERGAEFVRANERSILNAYSEYANRTAAWLGRSSRVVWLMEPDYHQYAENSQRGGGLSHAEMVRLFVAMVARIKRHLPAARISLDVSPWVRDIGRWMAPFLAHGAVDFVHTSGGRTTAASSRIRAQVAGNVLTWAELHRLAGRRGIIADTGYGVGGKLEPDAALDSAWTEWRHLRARVADGVIAVTFANPSIDWEARVSRLRTTLPPARHCLISQQQHGRLGSRGRVSRRTTPIMLSAVVGGRGSKNASSTRRARAATAAAAV